ncbi:peptidylprolyl isomerase [candidate division KSB1 bacterium]|nr:peptidylprolyl isomerase [candidate division KSB1 bacterium]
MSCEKKNVSTDSNALAVIGKRIIDKDYFSKRYQDFRRQTGASDNGMARRSVLNNMIAEELLILEARSRGYDEDAIGRHEFERIKVQELLNTYHNQFIVSRMMTTEAELRMLFANLNIKLKARHLYAPTLTKADSIYHILQQGVPFEEIARTCFEDPVLRESGGSLGYFTVDEMEPAFEEAAYALKIGEISSPVRTREGYSIIRVDDRIGNPIVTEIEFAKHRPKLEAYWKKRKIIKATQQHADSLRSELNVTFNESIVHKLFGILNQQKGNELIEPSDLSNNDFPELENNDLVYSKLGTWNVKQFQEAAQFTSEQQRSGIRNEENLKDYIAGLVIRSFILAEAKKNKLDRTSDYKMRIAENFDTALLERVEEALFKEFEIPEDTLRHYFEDDPTLFMEPPKVQLQEIALLDKNKVEFIAAQLERGVSFADLATKYSENKRSAVNGGDIGYLTPNELGKWAKQVLAMEVGEWIGPLEINSSFVFLKCIDRIPGKARTFDAAKPEVEQTLRSVLWERIRQQQVESLRTKVAVKSYPEKLIEIHVN